MCGYKKGRYNFHVFSQPFCLNSVLYILSPKLYHLIWRSYLKRCTALFLWEHRSPHLKNVGMVNIKFLMLKFYKLTIITISLNSPDKLFWYSTKRIFKNVISSTSHKKTLRLWNCETLRLRHFSFYFSSTYIFEPNLIKKLYEW